MGVPYWCNHAIKIKAYANHDRNHGDNKNGCVDMQDEVTKPSEEKYEGYVDKPGDSLCHHRYAFRAFE